MLAIFPGPFIFVVVLRRTLDLWNLELILRCAHRDIKRHLP